MKIQIDNHANGCIWHDGNERFFIGEEPPGSIYILERKFLPVGRAQQIRVRAISLRALLNALDRWNNQVPKLWKYTLRGLE